MEVATFNLQGVKLITPQVFKDNRGFFLESYNEPKFHTIDVRCPFVQDNHSYSKKETIRGMHFQTEPGQDKLVRVVSGKIYDVFVDIRPDSPTFKQWQGIYLDAEHYQMLFIPKGFAHGFCVVSEEAHVLYKVSSVYNPATEVGFRWDDPEIGIAWPVNTPTLSARDLQVPFFKDLQL